MGKVAGIVDVECERGVVDDGDLESEALSFGTVGGKRTGPVVERRSPT